MKKLLFILLLLTSFSAKAEERFVHPDTALFECENNVKNRFSTSNVKSFETDYVIRDKGDRYRVNFTIYLFDEEKPVTFYCMIDSKYDSDKGVNMSYYNSNDELRFKINIIVKD